MNADFWHQRWAKGEIAFHESEVNPYLQQHIGLLNLVPGSRVFVPLCGKTQDIGWLLSKGYRVVGVELSELAVEQLFQALDILPEISSCGDLVLYRGESIDIFVGDLFHLSRSVLGPVDAIYDRAALVALTSSDRVRYCQHLMETTNRAPQLLVCYEYQQALLAGPPFSITVSEIERHYGRHYQLTQVEKNRVKAGLKGLDEVQETLWWLDQRGDA
ncbi:thiopurine S-methyltransferase [Aestuariirhabdus sp. Z084]|uniref:thiopurine S-methyltransferase n=1 Tax=Aestuariirhabdus haliotis TaxID=2918751 RepID=UPI00201B36FB|nr:thiopurine S-methyltransferase [Aestuariirhabdus haliotis]MCL6416402.1 thiopurine S-methyltransferase [Aestuariirhabdus haliotis]MCL6420432.1 thiopurine S-methyltransferase [Aestuariirhabdus haliotis]